MDGERVMGSVANQDLWWKLQEKLRELEEERIMVHLW